MNDMGSELGCQTSVLKKAYETIKSICVIGCKAKLVFVMYSAQNTDKVQMKKHAVSVSNSLQAYEVDPIMVESIAPALKTMKKFQFLAPRT